MWKKFNYLKKKKKNNCKNINIKLKKFNKKMMKNKFNKRMENK